MALNLLGCRYINGFSGFYFVHIAVGQICNIFSYKNTFWWVFLVLESSVVGSLSVQPMLNLLLPSCPGMLCSPGGSSRTEDRNQTGPSGRV